MQRALTSCSRKEYLRLDEQGDGKHEFFGGEVFAMTGGSFNHAAIGLNISSSLAQSLHGGPCRPMNSDMRVHTPSGLDTYPDVSVFCGEPELSDRQKTLLNPVVIIEVLSPTIRNYDRGDKFFLYRTIVTLQDYLLVDADQALVEHFRRLDSGEWLLHEYRDISDEVTLVSIDATLMLTVIYESIAFEQSG
ncbi:MAG: Uma2 family endonuclease [bacterium]|nr:Uma2 family endonuclease [bacterium]